MAEWPDAIMTQLEAKGINAGPSERLLNGANVPIYLCQVDGNWAILTDDLAWGLISFPGYTMEQVEELLSKVDISASGLDIIGELEAFAGEVIIEQDPKALEDGPNETTKWLEYLGMK
ncbi:hypothetical protein TWF696_008966 [Orbilia brochopaga]|uniref:Uncharacterized protein n=1 Tax=Orbilia brochopaga TaxID=3140254 RepID=A0AAV9UHD0_9PEZI